ncbi:hypothetical protein PGT21_029619 [Puccinia graminis f. sp. tritici]|uniref:Uncharacterized protein n=1 Tax=Puccinia graminis f. sp. tritici TaxID=56615 RepID=A0A5B0QPC7_PUCGR|nr:hypothetical protein PGT21_029619 [Puccinia graminis f. sp. tritici]KAA1127190.1 hypothetical protein PGTUg99_030009 [Puccinia graminis f. sp. tritici]
MLRRHDRRRFVTPSPRFWKVRIIEPGTARGGRKPSHSAVWLENVVTEPHSFNVDTLRPPS